MDYTSAKFFELWKGEWIIRQEFFAAEAETQGDQQWDIQAYFDESSIFVVNWTPETVKIVTDERMIQWIHAQRRCGVCQMNHFQFEEENPLAIKYAGVPLTIGQA